MKKSAITTAIFLALAFSGCSTKSDDELFNLPPIEWQKQIVNDIKSGSYKEADSHYISFSSEHISSPILKDTLMILAQAYMEDGDYEKANAYIDEFIRRFGNSENIEYAQFLKIKANYESFDQPNRNQALMQESIAQIAQFLHNYPNSEFVPMVETMQIKFKLALFYLNQNIKDLYERQGKDESARIYEQRLAISGLDDANIQPPQLPWYRAFFE